MHRRMPENHGPEGRLPRRGRFSRSRRSTRSRFPAGSSLLPDNGGPSAEPARPQNLMKASPSSPMKTPRRPARPQLRAADLNEDVALFLGPKLLGELRILMRLAANSRNGAAPDASAKSF